LIKLIAIDKECFLLPKYYALFSNVDGIISMCCVFDYKENHNKIARHGGSYL
jgi:hypothetical protein